MCFFVYSLVVNSSWFYVCSLFCNTDLLMFVFMLLCGCYCPVSLPYGAIDSLSSFIVSVHTDLPFNISVVKSKLVKKMHSF